MTIHEPRKAVVGFNAKGEVDFVTKRVGFGDAQIEYVINGSGDAHKFATGAQQLKIREYTADAERRGISTYGPCFEPDTRVRTLDLCSPVTRNDVETIVTEACEGLNAGQRMKVQTWLGTILPDVEEKSLKKYGGQLLLPNKPNSFSFSSDGKPSFFTKEPA